MKSKVTIVLAVFVFGLLAPSAWARGMGGFSGGHMGHGSGGHFTGNMGHFGGGFQGGRGGQNLHFGVGTPMFRSPGVSRLPFPTSRSMCRHSGLVQSSRLDTDSHLLPTHSLGLLGT